MRESESPADVSPLRYAQPPNLGPSCRPLPRVGVLNTGTNASGDSMGCCSCRPRRDSPLYLVLQRGGSSDERRLIPIASASFDQTTDVIRVDDADVQSATAFDLSEFQRMGPAEVTALRVAACSRCLLSLRCFEAMGRRNTTWRPDSDVRTG